MVYKYCENENFEDFASGKVIIHRTGYPNFPVRLAQEIFGRCFHLLDSQGPICLYDPCCGGGYLLTVLGFLNFEKIGRIMASDVDGGALALADANLSLLSRDGLEERIRQINRLRMLHQKQSHTEALSSAENLLKRISRPAGEHEIAHKVFQTDILSPRPLEGQGFQADIVLTDVPYGNLVEWQSEHGGGVNFLDQLLPVLTDRSVVAVCSDKAQKFGSSHFRRAEKQIVGKRCFQIFRLA